MRDIKVVKAADLFEITKEIIDQGGSAWITVTGMSMYPFFRHERDRVELSKASFEDMKRGDIVLIKRTCGKYVLHRVLKKEKDCFYMIGDAQQWIEGPLKPEQLQAVVKKYERKKRIIDCNNPLLKICVSVWLFIIPIRPMAIKLITFLAYFRSKLFLRK
jgi:Peptidase S24-like.